MSRIETTGPSALRETATAAAWIVPGAFLVAVLNDPATRIMAVMPVALGCPALLRAIRAGLASARARRRAAAERPRIIAFPDGKRTARDAA